VHHFSKSFGFGINFLPSPPLHAAPDFSTYPGPLNVASYVLNRGSSALISWLSNNTFPDSEYGRKLILALLWMRHFTNEPPVFPSILDFQTNLKTKWRTGASVGLARSDQYPQQDSLFRLMDPSHQTAHYERSLSLILRHSSNN
jgi:hypothetical protein